VLEAARDWGDKQVRAVNMLDAGGQLAEVVSQSKARADMLEALRFPQRQALPGSLTEEAV
jgi:hypothetical protein